MSSKKIVKEGSTSYHPLQFFDKNGVAVTPESLRYRVTYGENLEIVPWTSMSPSATEVEVSAEINTIGTTGKRRFVTVEVTHNGGDKITEEIEYTLINLKGIQKEEEV